MSFTLIDSGPLVALIDPRDSHHRRAISEARHARAPVTVCLPVLVEAHHFLPDTGLRRRLALNLERGTLRLHAEAPARITDDALSWLERFSDHSPDFVDAFLVAWAGRDPSVTVWTFDSEFVTTWRTLSGKRLRLVHL